MQRISSSSISGALLILAGALSGAALAAAPSSACACTPPGGLPPAPAPPAAFVRIEGAGATLLRQTAVPATGTTTVRGNPCSGSNAAGALQTATSGNWSGSYSKSQHDYFVTSILGETPTGNDFWTLWINGRSSSTGACSTLLHPGDRELWFHCVPDASFNCTNNPLALNAPARMRAGRRVTVSVAQLDGAGHGKPFARAAVGGGGTAAVTGADGRATIVPERTGVTTLQAARSGTTPSDPISVCVYARSARECAVAESGPAVHASGIAEHQAFARGPRLLHGTAGPDASGLVDVSLSLMRRAAGGHCSFYDAGRGRWRAGGCHTPAPLFSVGASAAWSYLLPAALAPGAYRLEVIARDGNGRQTRLVTGVSRIDFSVLARRK